MNKILLLLSFLCTYHILFSQNNDFFHQSITSSLKETQGVKPFRSLLSAQESNNPYPNTSQIAHLEAIESVNCALQLDLNTTDLTCNVQNGIPDGTMTAVVTGSTGSVSYVWSTGATTASIDSLTAGSYSCYVIDAMGCTANAISTIYQPSPLFANLQITNGTGTVCQGDTVKFAAAVNAGWSYSWFQNGNAQNSITVPHFEAVLNGAYYVIIDDFNGCRDTSDTLQAVINPLPPAIISNTGSLSICNGSFVDLQASIGTGLSYEWLLNGNPISGATNFSYNAGTAGVYTVTVTSANNCQKTSPTKTVVVLPAPTASITPASPTSICASLSGVPLTTNLTGGQLCQWQLNGTNIPNANSSNYLANQTGNYGLIVTNTNACSDTAQTSITINPMPNASINPSGSTTFCQGNSVTLSAVSGIPISCKWIRNGLQVATTNAYTATQSGNYMLISTSSANCKDTNTIVLTVNPLPTPTVSYSTPILSTQLYSSYVWLLNGNPISGANSQTYTPSVNGNYSVYVTNANNCSDTSAQILLSNVRIEASESVGFSVYPNPSNNRFFVKYPNRKEKSQLNILNNVGQIIHYQMINDEITEIDLLNYASGIYFIEIKDADGLQLGTLKILKE